MYRYDEDGCPCDDCKYKCDAWEARYCCDLCQWLGGGEESDCDGCDPMDI